MEEDFLHIINQRGDDFDDIMLGEEDEEEEDEKADPKDDEEEDENVDDAALDEE